MPTFGNGDGWTGKDGVAAAGRRAGAEVSPQAVSAAVSAAVNASVPIVLTCRGLQTFRIDSSKITRRIGAAIRIA
jgi:hypothetical protein